ncbi:CHAT domain-containing protein [Sphingomonas sp. MMS24-JH45]
MRAFLTANARAVLATYWQVSAEGETDRFIQTLYGAARRRDIGSAVQTAQLQMMKEPATSHPFYWCLFPGR